MDRLLSLAVTLLIIFSISRSFGIQKKKRGNRQSASTARSAGPRIPYAESGAPPRPAGKPAKPAPAAEPAGAAAKPTVTAAKPAQAAAKPAVTAVAAMATAPEGSLSTQGEQPLEHARHQARVAAREAQLRRERESMEALRNLRLEKLRAAVVMSEVLGKPVALRPRGRYGPY